MKQRSLAALTGPFIVSVTLVLAAGCRQPPDGDGGVAGEPPPGRATPVVDRAGGGRAIVIGIDGAARPMVDAMIARGELPNLARVGDLGVSGRMRPAGPLLSPRIWTSFVTGVAPERHGIESWVWFDAERHPHLYASSDRRVPALWNILDDAGRSVAALNWLMTHPPEPVDGVIVSDHVLPAFSSGQVRIARKFAERAVIAEAPDSGAEMKVERSAAEAATVHPPAWTARIEAQRKANTQLSGVENPFDEGDGIEDAGVRALSHLLWESFENNGVVARMALEVTRELRPDLTLVYLPGIDRSSHLLWPRKLYFGEPTPPTDGDGGGATDLDRRDRIHFEWLRVYYRYVDDLIGVLSSGYGSDDLVIVLSDHSFERAPDDGWPPGRHDTDAARDGVFFARGPGVRRDESVTVSMLDIAPSLLAWLGLPVAADMPGDAEAFIDQRPFETIASYGTLPARQDGPGSADEDARIEALRLLGYVD